MRTLTIKVTHLLVGAGIALAGLTGWATSELTRDDVQPYRPVVELENLTGHWDGVLILDGQEACAADRPCEDAGLDH